MPFGTAVITFRHLEPSNTFDDYGNPTLTEVDVDAPGCRHRPLKPTEKVELNYDIATELWRSTLPLSEFDAPTLAAATTAKADDVILVGGVEYQIIGGVMPFDDFEAPFKMTIFSQKQTG
jgi:hypothetical protein